MIKPRKSLRRFLLVGNGPYLNRGCEAIVRGTMAILERAFGEDLEVTLGTVGTEEVVAVQMATECDRRISHVPVPLPSVPRWSAPWWRRQMRRCLLSGNGQDATFCNRLDQPAGTAHCALQIGGDNYTLEYGRPEFFMAMDRYLFGRNVPVVLWGASVGPFDSDPALVTRMRTHLGRMTAILVRERESYDYLRANGLEANVHLVADPAFVMPPCQPHPDAIGCSIPEGAIGINFSPLMARYVTGGDMGAWTLRCAGIVRRIVETTKRNVLLLPHVTGDNNDDYALLSNVARICQRNFPRDVVCIHDKLSAAETKWVIAQCAVFVGARTHATIGAISALVPTISLAYSRKARGLNRDIYGCHDFCIEPVNMFPEVISERVMYALENASAIRAKVATILPGVRDAAYRGGEILKKVLQE